MKILICYASLGGCAKNGALRIAKQLHNQDVTVVDLQKTSPNLSLYDAVVVGSSVYFGKLQKDCNRFLKQNTEALLQKPLFLYFCCGLTSESEDYRTEVFPKALFDHATSCLYFGGSLDGKDRPLLHRIILWKMRSVIRENELSQGQYTPTLPGFLPENADRMAAEIRENAITAKK